MIFWKWERKIKVDKISMLNPRIQADLYRWEHQLTSTHMHVFRSDGEPLKIDEKTPQTNKDAFEREELKLNFSGIK